MRETREFDQSLFRMSLFIERNELVALATDMFEGPSELESALRRCNDGFVKKLENKLWNDLKERYPERDFTGEREVVTRKNLTKRLKTSLKSKFYIVYSGFKWVPVVLSMVLRPSRKTTGDQVHRGSSTASAATKARSRSPY